MIIWWSSINNVHTYEPIKAEIERQLWTEEGLYMVLNAQDLEVKAALEQLKKVKP